MFKKIFIYVSFSLLATILSDDFPEMYPKDLEKILTDNNIVPEFVQDGPKYFAKVTLDSGKEVNLGDAIRVKDLKVQPVIQWPHNATTYYSLVITDFDDDVNWDPLLKEYHLLFICNIPGNNISAGYVQAKYIPPEVISKPHRITVIVVEQLEKLDLDSIDLIDPPRYYFTVMEIVYEYEGIIHAGNFFTANIKPWRPEKITDLLVDK